MSGTSTGGGVVGKARQAVWGPASTKLRKSKAFRQPAIVGYRALARVAVFGKPPRILANSIPKAGTHVLTQLLANVHHVWYSGLNVVQEDFTTYVGDDVVEGAQFDVDKFDRTLRTVHNGQFMTCHIGHDQHIVASLDRLGFRPLLMVRDPRDIVVSTVHYQVSNRRLRTHTRFADDMKTFDERLLAAITGLPPEPGKFRVPSLGERLRRYRPWLSEPGTLVVRFEDIIGSRGGGSPARQVETVVDVLRHCDRFRDHDYARRLAEKVFAPYSATFRSGTIGGWRDHFTAEHLAALAETAPGELAAFGYADD